MNFQSLSKPANRWVLVLILSATAVSSVIVVYGISQANQTPKPDVVAAQPTPSPTRKITALGRLEPEQEVSKVSVPATLSNDRVAQLLVQRGDSVEANQVIAIMDSRDRLQNALLEAQAQVKIAQAELAKVRAGAKSGEIAAQNAEVVRIQEELKGETATQQATIARWQAQVDVAQADYDRYSLLYQDGAIAVSDLDQRRLTLETTQAQLKEVKAQQSQSINTLQEQITQARATLNQVSEVRPVDVQAAEAEIDRAVASARKAEADLEEAYIRAPMAGRVFEISAKPGEVVGENGIAEIGQTDQMQVVAEVYQTDIQKSVRVSRSRLPVNHFLENCAARFV